MWKEAISLGVGGTSQAGGGITLRMRVVVEACVVACVVAEDSVSEEDGACASASACGCSSSRMEGTGIDWRLFGSKATITNLACNTASSPGSVSVSRAVLTSLSSPLPPPLSSL